MNYIGLEAEYTRLTEMQLQKDEIEELRKAFSVLPICREVVRIDTEINAKLNDITV